MPSQRKNLHSDIYSTTRLCRTSSAQLASIGWLGTRGGVATDVAGRPLLAPGAKGRAAGGIRFRGLSCMRARIDLGEKPSSRCDSRPLPPLQGRPHRGLLFRVRIQQRPIDSASCNGTSAAKKDPPKRSLVRRSLPLACTGSS